MASKRTKRFASRDGYTLVELLVGVTIFGILAALGLPHVDSRRQDLNTAVKQTVGDIRLARSRAITTGDHFCIEFVDTNNYKVRRMEEAAGAWVPTTVIKTGQLPSHIQYVTSPGSELIEFNTRGMMVSSTQPIWPTIWDTIHSGGHQLSIWPSGQVYEEN
jgi:prepilin-type N-terminal cleavage/methylation domain-containing protein